jgi:hypothetical protein
MAKLIVAFLNFANAAKNANRGLEKKNAGSLKQHLFLGHRVSGQEVTA